MSDEHILRQKFSDIGVRYLARTGKELDELHALVLRLQSGDGNAVKEIELLAHRIHGSGAMFGFQDVSQAAGALEMQMVNVAKNSGDLSQAATQAVDLLRKLAEAVRAALGTLPKS